MKKIILLTFVIMLSMTVKSQFYLAVNNDNLSLASSIQNTGNAVTEFFYQPAGIIVGDMRVSVSDGIGINGFAWSLLPTSNAPTGMLYTSGNLPLSGADHDVALGEKGQIAMVVYVAGQHIILEQYKFDVLQNGFYLQSGPVRIGNGVNPNIDIYSFDGQIFSTIIVWQNGNEIKARTAGGYLGTLTPTVVINSNNTGNDFYKPDVTIKGSGLDPNGVQYPQMVSFTYIEESQTDGQNLCVQQEFFSDIANSNIQHNMVNLGLKWITNDEEYGHPRIASPWQLQVPYTGNLYDCSVVVDWTDNSTYRIQSVTKTGAFITVGGPDNEPVSINYNTSQNPNFTLVTTPTDNSINRRPALDYCGDNIVVSWDYFDDVGNVSMNSFEVLQRKLSMVGVPVNAFYSVVDKLTGGDQQFVSVSGRYSMFDKVLYSFSSTNSDLAFKSSSINSVNLRIDRFNNLGVYPNPFSSILNINLDKENNHIYIYDLNSRILYNKLFSNQSIKLDLGFLSRGIYILKIVNRDGVLTQKIERL